MGKILILANNDVGLYKFRKELIGKLLKSNDIYISLPYGELVEPLVQMGCIFIDTKVNRRGLNPVKDLKLIKNYLSIIRNVEPDLVLTYTIKPNIYGGIASRIRKCSYAANITGLGSAFERSFLLRQIAINMYKVALKSAKAVFFENDSNRDVFVSKKIVKRDNAYLLYGAGVNLEQYKIMPYPKDEKEFRFLFMGRVMREKGIDELFAVMRRLRKDGKDCVLDVAGELEEEYEEIIKECEKEGWLRYYGHQKDVKPFIEKCHCFVLPSWHEGMANANLESAASGRPVITSDIPGCKEAVIDRVSGFLCKSRNEDALYYAMNKMLSLPEEDRINMGIEGRHHMEEKFDKNKVVDMTVSYLQAE